jgi:hypothetical protein
MVNLNSRARGCRQLQRKYLTNELYRGVIDGSEVGKDHVCEFGNFSSKQLGVSTVRVKKSYVSRGFEELLFREWYSPNRFRVESSLRENGRRESSLRGSPPRNTLEWVKNQVPKI